MYGRLRYVYVDLHGNHDVRQEGRDDARDGVHASGLRRYVRDGNGLHDAHFTDVREDVCDVLRNVHDVRGHVHENGQGRDDEALWRDVQAVC